MPGAIRLPMSKKSTAGEWVKPSDWPNIDNTADNEIQLLVKRNCIGYGFTTTIAGSGTYSIDWGDGTIQNGCTSATLQQHQYEANVTDDYMVVRIYGATGNITNWRVAKHTFCSGAQYPAILQVVFGAKYITSYNNAFKSAADSSCPALICVVIASMQSCTDIAYMFNECVNLEAVTINGTFGTLITTFELFKNKTKLKYVKLPLEWSNGNMTVSSMFYGCTSLESVKLPSSWRNVYDTNSMFYGCTSLKSIELPSTFGGSNMVSANSMFYGCTSLKSVKLPSSWAYLWNVSSMFYGCTSLKSIELPSTGLQSNITYANMFYGCTSLETLIIPSWIGVQNASNMLTTCYSLRSLKLPTSIGNVIALTSFANIANSIRILENAEYLGSLTTQVDMTDIFTTRAYDGEIRITSLLSRFKVTGASATEKTLIPSIRLTNQGSLFAGSSPQVDVSYNALDATALNALFNDLPTLTGRTIKITGNVGAATCNTAIATAKGWTVTN